MTTIHIPAGAKSPANRLEFTAVDEDGESCTFNIPKRGYYTRRQIKAMDAAGKKAEKPTLSDFDRLVLSAAILVEQSDPKAAEFLRGDNIVEQWYIDFFAKYNAVDEDGDVTEGESAASAAS